MEPDDEVPAAHVAAPQPVIDYLALVRAYKLIRRFVELGLSGREVSPQLKLDYERWRHSGDHVREKEIAERVLIEERLMTDVFYRDQIERIIGFSIDTFCEEPMENERKRKKEEN